MGFDTALFVVQPVDENLLCGICHDVLDKPTTVCGDGHTFCAGCLSNIPSPVRCPCCRAPALASFALSLPLQNMIKGLAVRCKHHDAANAGNSSEPMRKRSKRAASSSSSNSPKGCEWQGNLGDVETHLRSCRFEAVDCPLGCGKRMTKDELDAHQKACPRRMVLCRCEESVRADELEEHKASVCMLSKVTCGYCKKSMLRGSLGASATKWCHIHSERWCTGHYKDCPKLTVRCPFDDLGCCPAVHFLREDAAAHHAKFAHAHACAVAQKFKELEGERVEMTFEITQAKLRGGRSITLRSSSCEVAGKEMYITLKAAAQNRPVQIYICAEAPRWTPVRIDKVSISAGVAEELGTDGAQLDKPESVALEVNRDISEDDPVFGGELMCHREGTTRIEYDDDDSDAESEYEYEDVPATRADLLTGVDDDGKVCISAHFRVRKNNKVTVLVQED